MKNLQEIFEPTPLSSIRAWIFDGDFYQRPEKRTIKIEDGKIAKIGVNNESDAVEMPENVIVMSGGINLHVHGRDAYNVLSGMSGDQSYKEDSYTLSLALAQGGATYAMCMLNFNKIIETEEQYRAQINWMNNELPHRKKPIMSLGAYVPIRPGSKPQVKNAWFKLFWKTFGGTNFQSDEEVRETLRNYPDCRVKAHLETITNMIDCPALPHHMQRPKEAAINATRMFLEWAEIYNFIPDCAHIGTAEEIRMIKKSRGDIQGLATYEITPQSLALDNSTFEKMTGLPARWGQQNPPLRNYVERQELIREVDDTAIYASDHAPHTCQEKEQGISGMPQASTDGQVYLEQVSLGHSSLSSFVKRRSINPGRLLERDFDLKMGRLEVGYDASFTLITLGKTSQIRHADVLSKCAWTPYDKWGFSNTIEGVIVQGTLYTQESLKRLKT